MTLLPMQFGTYPLGQGEGAATLGQLLAGLNRGAQPTQAVAETIGNRGSQPGAVTLGQMLSGPERAGAVGDSLDTISRDPSTFVGNMARPEPFSPSIAQGMSSLPQPEPAVQPVRAEPPDYEKLRSELASEIKDPGTFQKIMMILGPMLASFGGNDSLAGSMIGNIWDERRNREKRHQTISDKIAGWQYDDWQRADEARKKAAEPFSLNNRRLSYDPDNGEMNTLYTAPQDWEDYAASLGLTPGSDAYNAAMQDYVLKTSGPTAHDFDVKLDDHRTDNDIRVEGVRQGNRLDLEGVRQGNRVGLEDTRQRGREALRGTLTAEQQARLRGPRGERPSKVVTDGKGNYQGLVNGRWTPLALPNQQEY